MKLKGYFVLALLLLGFVIFGFILAYGMICDYIPQSRATVLQPKEEAAGSNGGFKPGFVDLRVGDNSVKVEEVAKGIYIDWGSDKRPYFTADKFNPFGLVSDGKITILGFRSDGVVTWRLANKGESEKNAN